MKCEECQVDYPQHILSMLRATYHGATEYKLCCGICALSKVNELRIKDGKQLMEQFPSTHSERLRQQAIKWREDHSNGPDNNKDLIEPFEYFCTNCKRMQLSFVDIKECSYCNTEITIKGKPFTLNLDQLRKTYGKATEFSLIVYKRKFK